MSKYFHGVNQQGPYFEGWYFKCQSQSGEAIALIPALHINNAGQESASLQIIAESGTWWLEYPVADFCAWPDRLRIQIGTNVFSDAGLSLDIKRSNISLCGRLDFGPFLPLSSDIMGPFRFFAGMECSHGVISMMHSIQGPWRKSILQAVSAPSFIAQSNNESPPTGEPKSKAGPNMALSYGRENTGWK